MTTHPTPPAEAQAEPVDSLALAIRFHETYERLAPSFGYETRPDTRAFDPTSKNGRLMVAVCGEMLAAISTPAQPTPLETANAPLLPIPRVDPTSPPCGECSLGPGERCDICGRVAPAQPAQAQGEAVDPPLRFCQGCGEGVTTFCRARVATNCKLPRPATPPAPPAVEPAEGNLPSRVWLNDMGTTQKLSFEPMAGASEHFEYVPAGAPAPKLLDSGTGKQS